MFVFVIVICVCTQVPCVVFLLPPLCVRSVVCVQYMCVWGCVVHVLHVSAGVPHVVVGGVHKGVKGGGG